MVIANPRRDWVENQYNFIEMSKTDSSYNSVAATVEKMIEGQSGIGRFSIGGVSRICAYQPITASKTGWSLGVVAPTDESPVVRVQNGLLLVGLVLIVLSAVAAFFFAGKIEKPFLTVKRQETYLQTINGATAMLLGSDEDEFGNVLHRCMGMIAECVGVDRLRIWKNHETDGELYCTELYEWAENVKTLLGTEITVDVSYNKMLTGWEEALSSGICIEGRITEMSAAEQAQLAPQGIISLLVVPIFYQEKFWGFIGLDDCHKNREFSEEEKDILRSGGLLFVNALLRNEMMRDLIKAREEAVSSTEAKADFLANMSHEMRTPLNAIIGLSELTLDGGGLGNEEYNNLERVYNSGMTLLSLINDILDISKIEAGKFELVPVDYDTPSLINDTTTLNIVRIGSKPIDFTLDIDENLPNRLIGDELRIKQIFNNLLSNAFKYTHDGTVEWKITSERDGDDVWLVSSVTDSGIGMRKEDMGKIFGNYNQLDTARNRKIQGTGLGLAITKQLVEMMDGEITAESEYGKGTTFTVRLKQGYVGEQVIGADLVRNLKSFQYSVRKRDRSAHMMRAHLPYARVLVVDDVPTNLDVARGMMKPYGMKVDCVSSGTAAIELIKNGKEKYDAIFMDHMMPEMDGIEATRIIRNEIGTDYAKNIPIIALTANAILGNEELFLGNGFQAFIPKPIDIMRLDAAINQWVRNKKYEKEHRGKHTHDFHGKRSGTERRIIGNRRSGRDRRESLPKLAKHSHPDTVIELAPISGLNIFSGLLHFDNDEGAYVDVLKSYAKNTPPLLEKLPVYAKGNLPDYAIVVHGIKSSSRSIGADELGSRAEMLERAAKANDAEFVREKTDGFVESVQALTDDIHEALLASGAEKPKPTRSVPDKDALRKLHEACMEYDIDLAEEAMNELDRYYYESQSELIEWLRAQISILGFKKIAERLSDE
jgi:signal transduction histidine kinase/DNA-binding response OmpR family regulator